MFNLGAGEIALILVAALLLLGPERLPELARGIGKFMREFRRQTDDVRGLVEREFYKMDQEVFAETRPERIEPPRVAETGVAAAESPQSTESASAAGESPMPELPPPAYPSVFPPPQGVVAANPVTAPLGAEGTEATAAKNGEPPAHG
jgi:sec-independent protein translocase protein TatB